MVEDTDIKINRISNVNNEVYLWRELNTLSGYSLKFLNLNFMQNTIHSTRRFIRGYVQLLAMTYLWDGFVYKLVEQGE